MDGVPELKPRGDKWQRPLPPPFKSPSIPHLCMALILAASAPLAPSSPPSPHDPPPRSHLCVALTLLAASVIFAFGLFMMCPSSSTQ